MLTFGHTAFSYLLSQPPRFTGKKLTKKEVIFIVICGNLFDVDFIVPYFFGFPGGAHHYFPTHTPLMGIIYSFILYGIFRKKLQLKVLILGFISLFSHLIFDDLSYWFYLVGLEKFGTPQIFWLYPFDPRREIAIKQVLEIWSYTKITNMDVLRNYIFTAPKLFLLEITLVASSLVAFIKTKKNHEISH